MKTWTPFLLTALALCTFAVAGYAKPHLPVDITCAKAGASGATITVVFQAAPADVVITVVGTGSLKMEKVVRRSSSLSANQVVTIPVSFEAGPGVGGLVVEVASGVGSEVRSFDIVAGTSKTREVREKSSNGQAPAKLILVPAQTSTKQR